MNMNNSMTTPSSTLTSETMVIIEGREEEVQKFLNEYGIAANRKKRRILMTMSSNSFSSYCLGIAIARCCKNMDLNRAFQLYMKSKADGVVPNQETFTYLLSLTAGLGDQGMGNGPLRETEPPNNIDAAFVVFNDMKDLKLKFHESSYTAMVRCCCINDRPSEALVLFEEMLVAGLTPKLRTFNPLLAAFSKIGDGPICFDLFDRLVSKYALVPSEREYLSMLRVTLILNDGIRFYEILHQMMEDVLVPSKELWPVVTDWFANTEKGYRVELSEVSKVGIVQSTKDHLLSIDLDESTRLCLLNQVELFATSGDTSNVSNNSMDGCELKEDKQNTEADKQNENNTDNKNDGNNNNQKKSSKFKHRRLDATQQLEKWSTFQKWLASKKCQDSEAFKYDIVIDGANVGYYNQNYLGAPSHVDYQQIDWMVRQVENRGYRPLLVLHSRHLSRNTLSKRNAAVIADWISRDLLLQTPAGCNDDWFWLYTAVAIRAKVVTNDEMRDHHFLMLSPKWFSRWKERNQIRFSFGAWVDTCADNNSNNKRRKISNNECTADLNKELQSDTTTINNTENGSKSTNVEEAKGFKWKEALLSIPLQYSHRVQRLGARYYFPAQDSDVWLCCYNDDEQRK